MNKSKELVRGEYVSLFVDKDELYLGISDGVGHIGSEDEKFLRKLYKELDKRFKDDKRCF